MTSITLPLGTVAEYRGMTGRDEDLLTNRKKVESGEALNELLSNCTLALVTTDESGAERRIAPVQAGDIKRLKQPDRLALLLAIRVESFGAEMTANLEDPDSKEKFSVTVDLSTLEQKPAPRLPNGAIDPGPYTVELSNGQKVMVDYLDGKKEQLLTKTRENLLTAAMFYRIVEVQNVHANDIKKWLMDLPVRLRNELRGKLEALDCGPVTKLTADAPSGEEVTFDIQGETSFFFPTA